MSRGVPFIQRSFIYHSVAPFTITSQTQHFRPNYETHAAVVNPDNVKKSVWLYTCGSDGRIIIECSMK